MALGSDTPPVGAVPMFHIRAQAKKHIAMDAGNVIHDTVGLTLLSNRRLRCVAIYGWHVVARLRCAFHDSRLVVSQWNSSGTMIEIPTLRQPSWDRSRRRTVRVQQELARDRVGRCACGPGGDQAADLGAYESLSDDPAALGESEGGNGEGDGELAEELLASAADSIAGGPVSPLVP